MKIKLLIVFTFLLVQQGIAQIEPGNIFVGGSFGINKGGNSVTIGINPTVHYFISDNISVGGSVGFNTNRDNPGEDNFTRTSGFNIRPAARYFKGFGDKLYIYGEAGIGFGTASSSLVTSNNKISGPKTSQFGIGLSPGLVYAPTEKIGFDFKFNLLSFNRTNTKIETGTTTTSNVNSSFAFGLNSLAPSLGVYFIIGS